MEKALARGRYSIEGSPEWGKKTKRQRRNHGNSMCSVVEGTLVEVCHFRMANEYEVWEVEDI